MAVGDPKIDLANTKQWRSWNVSVSVSKQSRATYIYARFRWVVCQLNTLRKCLTISALKTELSSLPRTLDETYERILLNIDQSYRSNAFKILQWLTLSARPVTIDEVSEMLAIELGERAGYHPDLKLLDPRDVMLMCSSLVTTRMTSIYDLESFPAAYDEYDAYDEFEELRLAHMSVADYLLSPRIRSGGANSIGVNAGTAHSTIAQTCLIYLLQPPLAERFCSWDDVQLRLKELPLLQYAAQYWPYHSNSAGDTIDAETWRLVQQFFATKALKGGGNFASWIAALTPDISLRIIQSTHPLYYAASFGMASVVQKLLETDRSIDINARGGRFGSPALQAACYRNHPKTAKVLLEAGADPMALNDQGESCMFWAAMRGATGAQRLLEAFGARFTETDLEVMRWKRTLPEHNFGK